MKQSVKQAAPKIVLAKEIGYCYGVEDAIDIAIELAKNSNGRKVYTYGYIIHNPDTIAMLRDRYGITAIESADDVNDPNAVVIIRTHGAKKSEIEKLKQKNIKTIDATCPFVIKTHRIVTKLQEEGYYVVVFGKSYHPEVIGILGQVDEDKIICVQTREDLEKINWQLKIACVFQSTVTFEDFAWAVLPLARKTYELKIVKTICEVTITRQKHTDSVAEESDAMIVIGGKNSSNTKTLVALCRQKTETYHVEDAKELSSIDLSGKNVIGITTGTSTPTEVVERVIEQLRSRYNATLEG